MSVEFLKNVLSKRHRTFGSTKYLSSLLPWVALFVQRTKLHNHERSEYYTYKIIRNVTRVGSESTDETFPKMIALTRLAVFNRLISLAPVYITTGTPSQITLSMQCAHKCPPSPPHVFLPEVCRIKRRQQGQFGSPKKWSFGVL